MHLRTSMASLRRACTEMGILENGNLSTWFRDNSFPEVRPNAYFRQDAQQAFLQAAIRQTPNVVFPEQAFAELAVHFGRQPELLERILADAPVRGVASNRGSRGARRRSQNQGHANGSPVAQSQPISANHSTSLPWYFWDEIDLQAEFHKHIPTLSQRAKLIARSNA